MQLKSSPLTIEHQEFTAIHIDIGSGNSQNCDLALSINRRLGRHLENTRRWNVELTVGFKSKDSENPAPYSGSITAFGQFEIAEAYPEEKQADLIGITAVSILYGACREMIANITARSDRGILSLPSVAFSSPEGDEIPTARK